MKNKKHFLPHALCIMVTLLFSSFAGTYHVTKTGNDNNAGSQSLPYLTISKAAQIAQPGDSVIVHTGEYREWVQPARGGSAENSRITYKAAQGETVVVKGSERIATWESQGNNVWKVDLPDAYFAQFGDWYPFRDTIIGRYPDINGADQGKKWLVTGSWSHLGEVYLNGTVFKEESLLTTVQSTSGRWFTSCNGTTQSIYANFGTKNPNTELVEINVRQAVFGKDVQSGINYITVDGFTFSQSAEEWLPTYTNPNSRGVVFASGTNWIIQNCTVTCAKMRGIVTDGGSNHIIRNNIVENCGSAGIAGAGATGSVVSGNWIRNIHVNRPFWGFEHGGIKFHTCSNIIISGNLIINVQNPGGNGVWLDWPNGNNRITGNLFMNIGGNATVFENPSGPHLVDNNVFYNAGTCNGEDGNIYVNNLFQRMTITMAPGWWGNTNGVYDKFFNNVLILTSLAGLPQNTGNESDYNAILYKSKPSAFGDTHSYIDTASLSGGSVVMDTVAHTVTYSYNMIGAAGAALVCPIPTTATIGSLVTAKPGKNMTNPDGSSLTLDKDFFQNCRGTTTHVGPFVDIKTGKNTYMLKTNSDFNYKASCIPVSIRSIKPVFKAVQSSGTLRAYDIMGRFLSNVGTSRLYRLHAGVYIMVNPDQGTSTIRKMVITK